MSKPKKDVKPWLAKQALSQVHIPPPKDINHSYCDVTKPKQQHQFDPLFETYNVFKGKTYKYILADLDIVSIYKVTRALGTKKASEISFVLEAIYKKGGVFRHPKVFQCDKCLSV